MLGGFTNPYRNGDQLIWDGLRQFTAFNDRDNFPKPFKGFINFYKGILFSGIHYFTGQSFRKELNYIIAEMCSGKRPLESIILCEITVHQSDIMNACKFGGHF